MTIGNSRVVLCLNYLLSLLVSLFSFVFYYFPCSFCFVFRSVYKSDCFEFYVIIFFVRHPFCLLSGWLVVSSFFRASKQELFRAWQLNILFQYDLCPVLCQPNIILLKCLFEIMWVACLVFGDGANLGTNCGLRVRFLSPTVVCYSRRRQMKSVWSMALEHFIHVYLMPPITRKCVGGNGNFVKVRW